MAKIIRLPDHLIDQIAAGEVIERPANVVKELVENSLDAGSTRVSVEIRDPSMTHLRIIDNGHGMSAEDLQQCVLRHATSKLRSIEDLQRLKTLGFRGEALSSIASVSNTTIRSRPTGTNSAYEVLTWMPDAQPREVPAAPGTTVDVAALFSKVPARLKFMRAPATELSHLSEACLRLAVCDPSVHLILSRVQNESMRVHREYLPARSHFERACTLFPNEELREFTATLGPMRITCVLGAPEKSRLGHQQLHITVNGRYVKERGIARAVAFSYGSLLPQGRYPVGLVALRLPEGEVDVNVHPQKTEVRFAEGSRIYKQISEALRVHVQRLDWRKPSLFSTSQATQARETVRSARAADDDKDAGWLNPPHAAAKVTRPGHEAGPGDAYTSHFWAERLKPALTGDAARTQSQATRDLGAPPQALDAESFHPQTREAFALDSALGERVDPYVTRAPGQHPLDAHTADAHKENRRGEDDEGRARARGGDAGSLLDARAMEALQAMESLHTVEAQPASGRESVSRVNIGQAEAAHVVASASNPLDIIGRLHGKLLVVHQGGSVMLLRWHAIDCFVRSERLRAAFREPGGSRHGVPLLFPERAACKPSTAARLSSGSSWIERVGFDVSTLGNACLVVRRIPESIPPRLLTDTTHPEMGPLRARFFRLLEAAIDEHSEGDTTKKDTLPSSRAHAHLDAFACVAAQASALLGEAPTWSTSPSGRHGLANVLAALTTLEHANHARRCAHGHWNMHRLRLDDPPQPEETREAI